MAIRDNSNRLDGAEKVTALGLVAAAAVLTSLFFFWTHDAQDSRTTGLQQKQALYDTCRQSSDPGGCLIKLQAAEHCQSDEGSYDDQTSCYQHLIEDNK